MVSVFLILWVICVSFGPAYNIVGDLGIFALMIGIAIFSKKIKIDRKVLPSLILFAVLIGFKAIGINNSQALSMFHSAYGVVNTALKLIALIFFLQVIIPVAEEYKYKVSQIFSICFHVSIFISIIILSRVGRNTYRTNISAGGLLLAPHIYITLSMFMVMALVYLMMLKKEKRCTRFILIILNILYLFMANYTTQLILAFLGIALVLILGSKMRRNNKIILIGLMAVIMAIGLPLLPDIIERISKMFFATNETVNVRLTEIVLLLRRQSIEGTDLIGRFDLIKLSLDSFKENLILGLPFSRYNTKMSGLVVGGHSEWPDDLARFGIVGMIIFGRFLYKSLKMILQYDKGSNKSFKRALIIFILLYGFSNPVIRYMEFIFWFLLVLYIDTLTLKAGFFSEEIV